MKKRWWNNLPQRWSWMARAKRQFLFILGMILGFSLVVLPLVAVPPISSAISITTPVTTAVAQATGSMTQGQQFYEAGRYGDAAQVLESVVETAQQQGNQRGEAIALRNLALVYQQLGRWDDAEAAINQSLTLIGQISNDPFLRAQALDVLGRLQFYRGDAADALATWEQTAALYDQLEDGDRATQARLNQAEALQAMGFYRRAIALLTQLQDTLADQPDSLQQVERLHRLGNALRVAGDLSQSEQILRENLALAERLQAREAIAQAHISLGNTFYTQGNRETALAQYRQGMTSSTVPQTTVQAGLNQLRVLLDLEQNQEAIALIPTLQTQIDTLPPGRPSLYARINLADALLRLASVEPESSTQAASLVAEAVQQSRNLGDRRAESYALGTLGKAYEQTGQWAEAQALTDQALNLAQQIDVPELRYGWEWQLGRVLQEQGDRSGAIAAYTSAITTLQRVRRDLAAANPEAQFSFRESIEPIHRELVSLLLAADAEPTQKELEQARFTIESLQLAELDNFFREACLNAKEVQIDTIDPQAVVFYPILLGDRLEVIVAFPGQPLQHYASPVPADTVAATSRRFLNQVRDVRVLVPRVQQTGQELYDWLVRPVAATLVASEAKTLVFVPDGVLRNVPMAALYDGDRYLIESYSVALAPTLQLLEAGALEADTLAALMGGLSEARQGFDALPGVEAELSQLQDIVSGQVILNTSFTSEEIAARIAEVPYPVVHLATHGEFGSKLEDTFILTWNDRLTINELGALLQNTDISRRRPIELLVLSACKTAVGDDRAALGLAGVAVRSGARSTIASLWYVSDDATFRLMVALYASLSQPGVSKAEALRQAQLALIQDKTEFQIGSRARGGGTVIDVRGQSGQLVTTSLAHPYNWSAFVLIGNWQ